LFSSGVITVNSKSEGEFKILELYTNPGANEIRAKSGEITHGEIVDVSVVSLSGKEVWKQQEVFYPEGGIVITNLELGSGSFIVRVKAGNKFFQGKLILKK
jgi:hypothetical protein